MSEYRCTVVIAFYNKIEILKLLLAGYERQSVKEFQVIIADDGSRSEIVEVLTQLIQKSPLDIKHIWHSDRGWRKNEMLNKTVVAADADYIIFTDGDCIPHKEFVKEHLSYQRKGVCLTGRRVNLPEVFSAKLTPELVSKGYLEKSILSLLWGSLSGKGNHVEKGIYIRSKSIRKRLNNKKIGILGCNFSLYKQDILDINGFDERYLAPGGGEDSDIEERLKNNHVEISGLNHIAVQYHMFHKELARSNKNSDLFKEAVKNKSTYTPFGIIKD